MGIIEVKDAAANTSKLTQRTRDDIKTAITDLAPSLMWGASASGIQSAKLSTNSNSGLTGINILRRPGQGGDSGSDGLPLQITPTELTLDIMGCPYITRGQQYFVDMGTGTTADNFYSVIETEHSIESGEYKTTVRMMNIGAFGRWVPVVTAVTNLIAATEAVDAS
jgi:hypothetical protein